MKTPIWKWIVCGIVLAFVASPQIQASLSCGDIEKNIEASFASWCSDASGTVLPKAEPCDNGCDIPDDALGIITKKGSSGAACGHSELITENIPSEVFVSHVHVCVGKEEPPCEGDECEPPPVCNTAKLWSETQFEYGFTTSTKGQAGLGCSGEEVIQAGVDEQVRFDVCLDGNVDGVLITPDSLPFYDETFVTVTAEQQQVTGGVTVLVEDAEVEGCSITATYRWAGVVAADTDTEVCLPDEPCWCEQFPALCDKETPCNTSAGLQIAVVPGWVEAEECYAHLKNTQELEVSVPGDLTLCWRGQGGPNLKVRGNLNGVSYNTLPTQGSTWIGGDFDLDGYLTASARDGDCSSGLYVPFLVHRTPPGLCLPWLP